MFIIYDIKVSTVMVNNSTNINKTNNHTPLKSLNVRKGPCIVANIFCVSGYQFVIVPSFFLTCIYTFTSNNYDWKSGSIILFPTHPWYGICQGWFSLVLWMAFNATFFYFSYIMEISFISGGNPNTRRKQPTCRKSLTNFII